MTKKLLISSALVASMSSAALAEGLERSNFSSFFLFEEGNYAEFALGAVRPDLPATLPSATASAIVGAAVPDIPFDNVAKEFNVVNFAIKTQLSDQFSLGLSYTSQGNGSLIDWQTDLGAGAVTLVGADVSLSTLSLVGKYNLNENFSLIGGLKRVASNDPTVTVPIGVTPTTFTHTGTDGVGAIFGVGYERPEIAMRIALTYETAIDLEFPVTSIGGGASGGAITTASIGDALNLQFQTGIAQNTLLFGNLRYSMWENNQVFLAGDPDPLTKFEDGYSISLGVARRLNDQWAVSASFFFDPGDGEGASELSPQGSNRALTLGVRHTLASGANIDLGATYSLRGDAVTENFGATLNDSKVLSAGLKISTSF